MGNPIKTFLLFLFFFRQLQRDWLRDDIDAEDVALHDHLLPPVLTVRRSVMVNNNIIKIDVHDWPSKHLSIRNGLLIFFRTSFLIPSEDIQGRMALLVTLFLVLVKKIKISLYFYFFLLKSISRDFSMDGRYARAFLLSS